MTAFLAGMAGGAVGSVLTFLICVGAVVLAAKWLARKVLG